MVKIIHVDASITYFHNKRIKNFNHYYLINMGEKKEEKNGTGGRERKRKDYLEY